MIKLRDLPINPPGKAWEFTAKPRVHVAVRPPKTQRVSCGRCAGSALFTYERELLEVGWFLDGSQWLCNSHRGSP